MDFKVKFVQYALHLGLCSLFLIHWQPHIVFLILYKKISLFCEKLHFGVNDNNEQNSCVWNDFTEKKQSNAGI